MDTLPEEILQEIMEYLRYSDLKCCRLVCKKFYDASLTFRIVNGENFAYGDHMIVTSLRYKFDNLMKILSATERKFYHFRFVNTEITAAFRDFVDQRAKFILSLEFDECKIMYNPMNFCESINECIELKSLELHDVSWPVCNHAATISLPALETMDISDIPEDMFNILMDTNVKNLHLRINCRHLNDVIYARGRLEDLKCVDLWDFCHDEELMNIADNLDLTTIRFFGLCVTNQCFKYFVAKQRRLQIVHIRNSAFITDESLVAIAENLKDLKELIISIYPADVNYSYEALNRFVSVTPVVVRCSFDTLNRIINFTPVRRLDVTGSVNVSNLVPTVGDVTVPKCLRQLRMSDVQNETHVTYIAENFISLTELELTESDGVTTETLQLICQNLKNLKKLFLSDCNAINPFENGVPRLTFFENFKNLEELDLSRSEWLSDSILETCFKLSSLRILNVKHCEQLTVKSFMAMPKNFPCLEDLNMDGLRVDKNILLSTVFLMKRLCKLKICVPGPITKLVLKSLYEHSDSLLRVKLRIITRTRCFIRSWPTKTFVESILW